MAKIIKSKSGDSYSYRVTIPAEDAREFIEKHGNEVSINKFGKGFKLAPIVKVVKND